MVLAAFWSAQIQDDNRPAQLFINPEAGEFLSYI